MIYFFIAMHICWPNNCSPNVLILWNNQLCFLCSWTVPGFLGFSMAGILLIKMLSSTWKCFNEARRLQNTKQLKEMVRAKTWEIGPSPPPLCFVRWLVEDRGGMNTKPKPDTSGDRCGKPDLIYRLEFWLRIHGNCLFHTHCVIRVMYAVLVLC